MSIPITRYVDIVSGVAGAASVPRRELIGRIFTQNSLVSPQEPMEFSTLAAVLAHFGASSEEYLRAVLYFGWVSPLITTPKKISFARYTPAATAPQVHSNTTAKTLATYTAITAGTLTVTMGGYTATLTGINLSGEISLAAVAAAIEDLIQAESYGGTQFTSATVTYDSLTNRFVLTGGDTGEAVVSVSGTVADALGWTTGETVCYGSAAQTPVEAFTASVNQSDNFGSFLFIPSLTTDEITAVATYNDTLNVMFQYCVPCTSGTAGTLSSALDGIGGVGLSLTDSDYAEMCQMIVLAATDYNRVNGVMTAMFKQFDLDATVTNETDADTYDDLRVNYIGQTQSAGATVAFYQRGVLMGASTDPLDMNTYGNEQWLKDVCKSEIMNLQLALGQLTASTEGVAQVLSAVQVGIDEGLENGVITVGKTLTNTQKSYITEATGDADAWRQVQNIGYWVGASVTSEVVSGSTTYTVEYLLIYAKADAIRKVEGVHSLI